MLPGHGWPGPKTPTCHGALVAGFVVGVGNNLVNNLPLGLIAGGTLQAGHATGLMASSVLIGVDLGAESVCSGVAGDDSLVARSTQGTPRRELLAFSTGRGCRHARRHAAIARCGYPDARAVSRVVRRSLRGPEPSLTCPGPHCAGSTLLLAAGRSAGWGAVWRACRRELSPN